MIRWKFGSKKIKSAENGKYLNKYKLYISQCLLSLNSNLLLKELKFITCRFKFHSNKAQRTKGKRSRSLLLCVLVLYAKWYNAI